MTAIVLDGKTLARETEVDLSARIQEVKLWLLIVYAKAKFDNLPLQFLAKLRYEVEHG
jgi:hypothetical protein